MKVKIHHEGQNILFVVLLILFTVGWMAFRFIEYRPIAYTIVALLAIFYLLVLNFFRLPRRSFKGDNSDGTVVTSSVDGTVVALEEVYEDEYLHRNAIQLSVFMTVFNVHANWVPVAGEVQYVKHHSGTSGPPSSSAPPTGKTSSSGRLQEPSPAALSPMWSRAKPWT